MRLPHITLFISCCLAVFLSVLYISCKKSATTATVTHTCVTCGNGGICNASNGKCICPAGYEGESCETISRNKFVGNWTVFEKGSITGAAQYPVSIQPGTNISDVSISNFYNYFTMPIKGYISGDTIYLPNQQYQGKVVLGIGYIHSSISSVQFGTISMRYEIIDTTTLQVNDFGYYSADLSEPSAWNK